MTTAQMNDPERDGDTSVGIPVDRTVRRLRAKLEQRDRRIVGLTRRIAALEAALASKALSATHMRWEVTRAVQDALCNVRMIPVYGVGKMEKIVEVKATTLPPNAELNGARRASDLSAELGAGD